MTTYRKTGAASIGKPESFGWLKLESHKFTDLWETPDGRKIGLDKGRRLFRDRDQMIKRVPLQRA